MFDFGLGSGELLVIAIVALIVIGPKDLPRVLRTMGQYMRKIQGMAREFQNHLNEAAREAGVDDVKKEVKGMTNFTVTADLDKQGSEIKRAIESGAPKAAATNGASGQKTEAASATEPAKPSPADRGTAPSASSEPVAASKPVDASKARAAEKPAAASKSKPAKPAPASKREPASEAKPRAKPKQKADRPHEAVKS